MRHNFSFLGLLVALGAVGGSTSALREPVTLKDFPEKQEPPRKNKRHIPRGVATHGFIGRGKSTPERDRSNLRASRMNYKGWCGRDDAGTERAA